MDYYLVTLGFQGPSPPTGPAVPASPSKGSFPGQTQNPVGFAASPTNVPSAFTAAGGVIWPGSFAVLTPWPGSGTVADGSHATSGSGTVGDPYVFAYYDFVGTQGDSNGAGGSLWIVNVSNSIFVGCRFAVNNVDNSAVIVGLSATPNNVNFIYCSVTPLPIFATSPPGYVWPSAGTGHNTNTYVDGVNCIPHSQSYQGGIALPPSGSNYIIDHCDIWGFGNSIIVNDFTSRVTISDCQIHDAANSVDNRVVGKNDYHTDGPGYLNGAIGPNHIDVEHCTICSIGTTNGIAYQQTSSPATFTGTIAGTTLTVSGVTGTIVNNMTVTGSGVAANTVITGGSGTTWTVSVSQTVGPVSMTGANVYDNMKVNNCYMSGFAFLIDMCHDEDVAVGIYSTNLTFTNNIISTDVQWFFGIGGTSNTITLFSQPTNTWHNNTFLFQSFTNSPTVGGYTISQNGQFVHPDGSVQAADF